MKNYVNVHISVQEEDYETAYAVLSEYDFLGMEEKFDEIILSFEESDWNVSVQERLERELIELLPDVRITQIEVLPDKNWNEEWEKNVQPVRISDNITITPEWKAENIDAPMKIIVNPKMSFGTGQHSTTLLISQEIERIISENIVGKDSWVDAGTGTGVLAIEAAKLGVKRVLAFDFDDWAYENALENVLLNKVDDVVTVSKDSALTFDYPDVDCITANMYISIIKDCLPLFHKHLVKRNGLLLVSGVLKFDRDVLLEYAQASGFTLLREAFDAEWGCWTFRG